MKPIPHRSALRARPVRRYRKPVYPAYSDPNPLDHPDSVPYPFSRRLVQWTVATGLVTVAATGSAGAQQPAAGNPFTLQRTGLPYVSVMYGTGLPERMEEKDVRAAIESAFSQEGIALQTGHLWQSSAGELYLDGYDSTSRTGYVFLDYSELGAGTSRRPEDPGKPSVPSPLEMVLTQQLAGLFDPLNRRHARPRLQEISKTAPPQRMAEYERLVQLVESGDPAQAEPRVVENFYLEGLFLRDSSYALPVRNAVQQVLDEKNARKRRALLKQLFALSELSLLVYYPHNWEALRPGFDRLAAEALRLSSQKPGKRRNARLQTLHQIVDMVRMAGYEPGWAPFIDKARLTLQTPAPGFWPAAAVLTTEFERYRASMPEIEALHREAKEGRSFIAVLSLKDQHTTLSERSRSYTPPPDSIRKDVKAREAWADEQYRQQVADRLAESRQRLEGEVRRFIQWARAQGRY